MNKATDEFKEDCVYFRGEITSVLLSTKIEDAVDQQLSTIFSRIDEFVRNGNISFYVSFQNLYCTIYNIL